jgi:hypothetical protein
MNRSRTPASVQQRVVRAREVQRDVLCLFEPAAPTGRSYRAMLEVTGLNFALKAPEEQVAIIETYRGVLKSLTFSLQILVRNQPLDLRAYWQQMVDHIPEEERPGSAWRTLVEGLRRSLQQLAAERTLLERHAYLVIPAEDERARSLPLLRAFSRKRQQHAAALARALHTLPIRCESLSTQLAALGLRSRRLAGKELTDLYYQCLQPTRALAHPLSPPVVASVGQPHAVLFQSPDNAGHIQAWNDRPSASLQESGSTLTALPIPDLLPLADLLAPASIEVFRDALRVDDEWVRVLAVTAFPREVSDGWLAPLLLHDDLAEVIFHLHPRETAAMLRQLKRRRAGYVSMRQFQLRQGRLSEPEMEVAQADVNGLLQQLASGEERVLDLSLSILLRAGSRQALEKRTERMLAVLRTLLLDTGTHIAYFEQAQGFRSCLPEARDELARTLTMDTASAAASFPFISNTLAQPGGTFLGLSSTREPVLPNPWNEEFENPNTFMGAPSGGGKSYLGKLWIARDVTLHGKEGIRCAVIDPDGEYDPLADALEGEIIRVAPGSHHHLNPFDLLPAGCDLESYARSAQHADHLAEKIQDLQILLDLMLAEGGEQAQLSKQEKGLLDLALAEAYRRKGITADPWTHHHEPPLLRDLYEVLRREVCGSDNMGLATRLARYVHGSLSGLFAGQTSVNLDTHLLVWNVREMQAELRAIGLFLIAEATWTQALHQTHVPRALYIDEAASILDHPEGGRFLANLSRRARKRYLRLVTMTQSPERFVQDAYGSVVASNAAIKILKVQDRTSIAAVAERFGLTRGEQQRLLTFGKQEALLIAGDRRVILTIQASPEEHALITTNPVELAQQALDTRSAGREE